MSEPSATPDPFAPPEAPVATADPAGAWRDDDLVVLDGQHALPARCFVCGAATGRTVLQVVGYRPPVHPATWLLALLGLGPLILVLILQTRRRYLSIPMCDAHRAARVQAVMIPVVVGSAGVLGVVFSSNPWIQLIAACVAVGGAGVAWANSRAAWAARIDGSSVHVGGASPAFLATLPQAPPDLVLLRTEDEI